MFDDDASCSRDARRRKGYLLKGAKQRRHAGAYRERPAASTFQSRIEARLMDFFATLNLPRCPRVVPELTTASERSLAHRQEPQEPDIASRWCEPVNGCENHVSNILDKCQGADRAGAYGRAREAGRARRCDRSCVSSTAAVARAVRSGDARAAGRLAAVISRSGRLWPTKGAQTAGVVG